MQFFPLKLWSSHYRVDFIKLRTLNYIFSITMSVIALICLATRGLNFGIDFSGGINIEISSTQSLSLETIRSTLNALHEGEVSVNTFNNANEISIKIGLQKTDSKIIVENIKKHLSQIDGGDKIEYKKIEHVGPQVGKELIRSGIKAVVLCFLGIMLYVWYRFEWQFGVGVLISLLHDAIVSIGFMAITQLDFNLSSIAAVLTIIGYSVNDSVVIYDRIRENIRIYNSKSIPDIINQSINETLSRTTLTVVVVLLTNLSLIIFGGEAIRSFSLLVFFGITLGTYSSIFLSAPILTILQLDKFKITTGASIKQKDVA